MKQSIRIIKKPVWLVLLIGVLTLSIVMSGCNSETTPAPTTNSPATTPAAASSAAPAPDKLSGTITEAGSTTVQPLAEKLANAFKAKNPDVNIVIQGGGSSVGIKSASAGTVDVGAASREVKEGDPPVQTFLLARDGIAIIVHPENTVDSLTKSQVRDIFAGTITNWKEVGGVDKEIHVVAREEGSGTRSAFQEMVMGKDDAGNEISIIKNAILQSSNGAVMQVVKGDAQSISFVSFGYVESTVKAVSIDGIEATSENAKSGTYPIVRPLYFLTKDNPTGLVKAFFDYCASDEAKQIIVSEGYIVAN